MLYHTLTFYGKENQKYGKDYFTNLDELVCYFSKMKIKDTILHTPYPQDSSSNTLIIAEI